MVGELCDSMVGRIAGREARDAKDVWIMYE
jgi:hypothetical protein